MQDQLGESPGGHRADGHDGSAGTDRPAGELGHDSPAGGTGTPRGSVGTPLDLDAIERDLAGVEAALARLDAGTYWTDEVTGAELPAALLAEHPTARRLPGA